MKECCPTCGHPMASNQEEESNEGQLKLDVLDELEDLLGETMAGKFKKKPSIEVIKIEKKNPEEEEEEA